MTEERVKRKLAAIFSADVKGYSRLMADDEEATVRTITTYRELMTSLIREHRGRVVDAKGDNVLAEFTSVVDAVRGAVEVQKEIKERNSDLPEHRRMEFRIGINLGDVIDEEGTIYGDGVNVAARLEGLAESGGICISGTAFDQAKNKLPVGYHYMGKQEVKNIPDPVRAYKVLMEPESAGKVIGEEERRAIRGRWVALATVVLLAVVAGALIWNFYFRPDVEPASVEKMAFPLPDKPSIAVLPFDNLTGDPEQNYIADGFTEDVITALSKVPKLFVVARSSSFTYKVKPVKVQRVAEDLGVRYVLEGSIRQSKDKMRITAQLIDATSGKHLWAERYHRELKDIFALQDEITKSIIVALQVKLTEGEQARVYYAKGTESLEAYLKHLQSREYFMNSKMDLAKQAAMEVIALDPKWAQGYSRLATLMLMEVWFQKSKSPKQSLDEAESLAKKAIQMDSSLAHPHAILGQTYLLKRQFDEALSEGELAAELCPSCADNIAWLGMTLRSVGRPEEAIQYLEKAIRLSPLASGHVYVHLGMSYFFAGHYPKALDALKTANLERPKFMPALIGLAAVCAILGEEGQANDAAKKILELHPKFSLDAFAKTLPYKRQVDKELLIDALRKAGLPKEPPLALPDKPSIAVLPFVNMSDDKSQEYFSDGLTEEIITALSKTPKLFVIARNSSFEYKRKAVNVQQVGRELGVKYVLEGSVRRSGEQLRITAQLIDATTGNHLWAERYDREMKDFFAIQDDVTMKILTSLQVVLTEGESAKSFDKGTDSLEAYLKTIEGRELMHGMNKDDNALARRKFEEAIELDPKFARAYAGLSFAYSLDFMFRVDPKESLKKAYEYAQKAVDLDKEQLLAHGALEFVYIWKRQHDMAIASGEQAVQVAPGCADAYFYFGRALAFAGRYQEAVSQLEKALRMNPFPPGLYYMHLGMAHLGLRQYDHAVSTLKKALALGPKNISAMRMLTVTYFEMGQLEDAKLQAEEILKIDPQFTSKGFEKIIPFKDGELTRRYIEALRKAGLERDI